MLEKKDYFKLITGRTLKERYQLPTLETVVDKAIKRTQSAYPLRLLGVSSDGEQYISEEERYVNFHVIGAPGEGKSKFLEYQIRKDIDAGVGLCLFDSSDFGATYQEIVKYCASIGHEKVVLIDPYLLAKPYEKTAVIKPLDSRYVKHSVEGVMELVNILFGARSETETPRIKRYLGAVLRTLVRNDLTLYESQYLAHYQTALPAFIEYDRDSWTIRNVFRSQYTWENYFSSTINRLDCFWTEPLSLMLGADTGIDFVKMLREGWVILCNLAPGRGLTSTEGRLLGVLIISQIIQAVDILRRRNWKGRILHLR